MRCGAESDRLARNRPAVPVANSYLIEALEDAATELSEGSGPRTIYVFSDMMQHAEWYSHLDLEWADWNFADFESVRALQTRRMGRRPSISDLAVQVHYLPRLDLTELPRTKRAHQTFWREYFAGASLTFHDQPPLPAYSAEPLMDRLTREQQAALEHKRIEKERAEAARVLAEVQRERSMLEQDARRQQQSLADHGEQSDARAAR